MTTRHRGWTELRDPQYVRRYEDTPGDRGAAAGSFPPAAARPRATVLHHERAEALVDDDRPANGTLDEPVYDEDDLYVPPPAAGTRRPTRPPAASRPVPPLGPARPHTAPLRSAR